jgi:hypothetical protein
MRKSKNIIFDGVFKLNDQDDEDEVEKLFTTNRLEERKIEKHEISMFQR